MRKLARLTMLALMAFAPVAAADPLPASRSSDWTHAGVVGGIPNRTTVCATFSPGATAAAINSAINACNNGVVKLNAGTYTAASLNGSIQLTNSGVTLRGAGADKTIIQGLSVLTLGAGGQTLVARPITGAAKGSLTFSVSNAASLAAGVMIEIDRDDEPGMVPDTGHLESGGRSVTQVNSITAVSGNTVTLRNRLFFDFTQGNPKLKFIFSGVTKSSGVEDLKIDHSAFTASGTGVSVQDCDSCWIKGVESSTMTGLHFLITSTLNFEVRDSFFHDGGAGPGNGGLYFLGNYSYGANSSAKVENNVFNKLFPAIEISGSSSGFFVGYNYVYGSPTQFGTNLVTWVITDAHGAYDVMNLYEGNIAEMWGVDSYYGGAGYGTVLRNYFTGQNPNFGVVGDAIRVDRLAYNYSLIGNVLGSNLQAPRSYLGCDGPSIYRLGYPNLGSCGTDPWDGFTPPGGYPDPKVTATLMRWGNYDYFTKTTRFLAAEIPAGVPTPTDQVIPKSYHYASKPTWWSAGIPWPPIGPDVTGGNGDVSGHVNKTPAQVCWESANLKNGGVFSAASCYAGAPVITSPANALGTTTVPFAFQVTASNSPTSYAATGLPAGLAINVTTGLISGTPTVAGVSTVRLTATNAKGVGSATLTLTIAAPAPPVITSGLTASGVVGSTFTYTVTASNRPTSFAATGLPAGLTLNVTTGVISGTPTAAGAFSVRLTARNAQGAGQATLALTVSATPTVLIGAPSVQAQVDSNPLGMAEVFQTVAVASGTVRSLSVYLDPSSTVTRLVLGFYADIGGRPGNLQAQAATTVVRAGAWNSVAIRDSAVVAGRTYWLAILGTGAGNMRFRDGSGACRAETSPAANLAVLPIAWVTGARYTSCPLAGYGRN